VNQSLFTAASYNAGLARIDRLRREASQKGLDPNPWFRDVENLPGRNGQETVQYVSSIYKYDLADREVSDQRQRAAGAN